MRTITTLRQSREERVCRTVFGGYNRSPVTPAGDWYDERNMTAEDFPLASVRRARYAYAYIGGSPMQNCCALHGRGDYPLVCYEDGSVRCNGQELRGLLYTENGAVPRTMLPKQIVSLDDCCVIWPDKVFVNAVKLAAGEMLTEGEDYGSIENTVTVSQKGLRLALCDREGAEYTDAVWRKTAPDSPEDGDFWVDTSNYASAGQTVLKQYSGALRRWSVIFPVYMKMNFYDGDGEVNAAAGFRPGDFIRADLNLHLAGSNPGLQRTLDRLRREYAEVVSVSGGLIVKFDFDGIQNTGVTDGTIRRDCPALDFVTCCGDRIWGCVCGNADGKYVNEIRSCAAGDFRNWHGDGTADAPFVFPRGGGGEFTGAVTCNGTALFFRETCVEKVFLRPDGAAQLITADCDGIRRGSRQSAAVIDGVLYYHGREGVYAYTGGIPHCISADLGSARYTDAVAGVRGKVYYISMRDAAGAWNLFTYDTARKLWHREDSTRFLFCCEYGGDLYFEDGGNHSMRIGGTEVCANVDWYCETGLLGPDSPDRRRIRRINLRLRLEKDAGAKLLVQYDSDGVWREKASLRGNGLRSVTVPLAGVRCDHLRLRLEGRGGMRLYALTYTVERNSDEPW